jgi:Tfp pilus assembly protein PilO
MTPKAILNCIAGVLLLVALGAGGYAVWSYQRMAKEVAELAPLKNQVAELQQQQTLLSAEFVKRSEFDSALRDARQSIHISLDKVTNEDPAARDYLGERIPDSVRHAATKQRAER